MEVEKKLRTIGMKTTCDGDTWAGGRPPLGPQPGLCLALPQLALLEVSVKQGCSPGRMRGD